MFDGIVTFLSALNALTPLGVAALLGVVILLLVHKKGPIKTLANNHLEHVQASLDVIADSSKKHAEISQKQLELLGDIKAEIYYVKAKVDK